VDGGRWRLYREPLELRDGETLTAKAVRYGWRESDAVDVELRAEIAD
jgi:hypothetical protein